MVIAGFRPSPRWLVRQSMTTRLVKPVVSSVFSATEAPSTRSSKADFAVDFGQHRTGVRIPFGDTLAALDLVALVDEELGAIGHAVRDRAVLALGIEDGERDVTAP